MCIFLFAIFRGRVIAQSWKRGAEVGNSLDIVTIIVENNVKIIVEYWDGLQKCDPEVMLIMLRAASGNPQMGNTTLLLVQG